MPRTRPAYPPEFRRQMVELVRAGRGPDELAKEFEPSGHSIVSVRSEAPVVAVRLDVEARVLG